MTTQSQPIAGVPGAVVRWTDAVPHTLPNATPYSRSGHVARNALLICPPGVGRCLIQHPDRVEFCPSAEAQPQEIQRFLRGHMLVSLLHYRGDLPLHASAVLSPDGASAVALCGASGAGKSTTTAALVKRGWGFLTDDVLRITSGSNGMEAWPGRGAVRLLPDACETLQDQAVQLPCQVEVDGKYEIPFEPSSAPARVRAIVCLSGDEPAPRLEQLCGTVALSMLMSQIPGQRVVGALKRHKEHASLIEGVLRHVPLYCLHGRKTASAKDLSDFLAKRLGSARPALL